MRRRWAAVAAGVLAAVLLGSCGGGGVTDRPGDDPVVRPATTAPPGTDY